MTMPAKTKVKEYIMTRILATDRRAIHAPDCEHADAIAQAVADKMIDVQQIDALALRELEGQAGAPYIDRNAACMLEG